MVGGAVGRWRANHKSSNGSVELLELQVNMPHSACLVQRYTQSLPWSIAGLVNRWLGQLLIRWLGQLLAWSIAALVNRWLGQRFS